MSTSFVYGMITVGVAYTVYRCVKPKPKATDYAKLFPNLTSTEILKQLSKNKDEKSLLESLKMLNAQLESPPTYKYFKDPTERYIELEKRKSWMVREAREKYLNKQQSFYLFSNSAGVLVIISSACMSAINSFKLVFTILCRCKVLSPSKHVLTTVIL